jgi:hypothetical protein
VLILGSVQNTLSSFYTRAHINNHLKAELNPICHLLALLGAHHILLVSRVRVKIDTSIILLVLQECDSWHLILRSSSPYGPTAYSSGEWRPTPISIYWKDSSPKSYGSSQTRLGMYQTR